jgi:hypothetical protein
VSGVLTEEWGWQPTAWVEDGLPTWRWRCAPRGLLTRRQMRAAGGRWRESCAAGDADGLACGTGRGWCPSGLRRRRSSRRLPERRPRDAGARPAGAMSATASRGRSGAAVSATAVVVVGEPRQASGAVAAGENGARWWATAAQLQRATRSEVLDHSEFYDLTAELVATLRTLEDLADTLARQTAGYGTGRRLRDDAGGDPAERLCRAMAEASALRINLAAAVRDGERFWSAVGHIGLELPTNDDAPTGETAIPHGESDRSSDTDPRGLW